MEGFFRAIRSALKAKKPEIVISIDLFGEVLLYGKEGGIGQHLHEVARYFDVVSPMAYPSHYRCGEFGVRDPTAHPYRVYRETLRRGLGFLEERRTIIRPWIQDFTIGSIYGCGSRVAYNVFRVREQIRAAEELGIRGFMLWNAGSKMTRGAFINK